ncbi:rhodanese-like domain-containing protein [Clostridium hydrogeniformans]|uniref:rhodanese-like domain-containing protein n=1 Tax=Clostridium hydrogeniformans TaxID=349933 RepID=UPI0005587155|nr:rhodanese-like domain-containing protein [Clostridium hydrogeniformans]
MIPYNLINNLKNKNVKNVTGEEAFDLLKTNQKAIILDVRTKDEYIHGHIPNALNIEVRSLMNNLDSLYSFKDMPIIVHCASGSRSLIAVNILSSNGFSNIYHISKGLKDWKHEISYGAK